MKFILGGYELNKYPAFNGLFKDIFLSLEEGAFIDDLKELNKKLDTLKPHPTSPWSDIKSFKIVDNKQEYPEVIDK